MWRLTVFLGLASASALETFEIKAGLGAHGWCDGFDRVPDQSLPTPTTGEECFNNCKATYDATIAVDFWPGRQGRNICSCQDACDCLLPSLPGGGDGVLVTADSTVRGPSCGWDMSTIRAASAEEGWCRGFDIKLQTPVSNHHQCFTECRDQHGAVAVDFWPDRDGKPCWCQNECPCRSPSPADGGNGYLVIDETLPEPHGLCYKIKAGSGAHGWCMGMDTGPDPTLATPSTAAECFSNCKATHSTTVAVDFWMIDHPNHNAGNICWCQDACDCTMPSKSDGGDGILFVERGTTKGGSCGHNMKTVVEGNDNSVCHGNMTAASVKPGGKYGCLSQCKADGFDTATYLTHGDTQCLCQHGCPCTEASEAGSGAGYLFVDDTKGKPTMCDSEMTCGDTKKRFKASGCCGNPTAMMKFH
jgi:hypothetical protein